MRVIEPIPRSRKNPLTTAGKSALPGYAFGVGGILLVTALLGPIHNRLSATTVALALLLVVLFVAAARGMGPAVAASVLGMLAFNFFFLPPLYTFTIADPQNWGALFAFLVTAVTAGQLSARVRGRAEEAENARREVERLYDELREAFDRASRAEALRQAERLRSALLDAVTHDLRTPLTSIKVCVTTMLDDESPELDDANRRELLEVINEETDRLDRLISNLVDLARIEAGQMRIRRGWTAPEDIVLEAVTRARARAAAHPIDARVSDDLPAIRVDGRALSEALYLLLDNAIKYSPAGSGIECGAATNGAGEVLFFVEDGGPGIPETLRARVFDKFFRMSGDPEIGATPSGTGMGLAIVKGIVETHGGRVWVESAKNGRGSRFVLAVPAGDDEAELPSMDSEEYIPEQTS